jgi:putative addiction module component (TIGR02574 family)
MNPIIEEALRLPKEEKVKLYYALQEELEAEQKVVDEEGLSDEQWKEVNRRMEEIESGKMKTISLEEHLQWLKDSRNALEG